MKNIYTDTETTGLHPPVARVIEIGWAEIPDDCLEAFNEMTLHEFRFQPTDTVLAQTSPRALEVNGYYRGHPDWVGTPYVDSEEAAVAWDKVAEAFTGARMLNQHIKFDLDFILAELRAHNILVPGAYNEVQPPWSSQQVCTRPMAKRFLDASNQPGLTGSLHSIYDYLQGPALPPHRAVADVLRAIWLHACYLETFEKQDSRLMKDAVLHHREVRFGAGAVTG